MSLTRRWQPARAAGAGGVERAEVDVQHVAGEEEPGAEGLVLRPGPDVLRDGEVGEETLDVGGAELERVAPAVRALVEAEELLDPAEVTLLRPQSVALEEEGVADLIEELLVGLFPAEDGRGPAQLATGVTVRTLSSAARGFRCYLARRKVCGLNYWLCPEWLHRSTKIQYTKGPN
jgi:hypothetical protein